ncbi:MAG TPA: peptidoglycan DD-metalloendopeptidase family protein [Saprospiraceae bacterium]|nr:peptidoglycan DD-metalloendopeptidase family protein [Saprospiraceae bacterium]HMP25797.1 peptidoglycan DD-metalloendopeptidase family protein [Saprospiraceae bacterium]
MDLTESLYQLKTKIGRIARTKLFKTSCIGLAAATFGAFLYWTSDASQILRASIAGAPTDSEDIVLGAFPVTVPTIKYGFALDTFQVFESNIRSGQFLADLLLAQKVDYPSIEKIVANAKGVFSVNELRTGNAYTILTKDSTDRAEYLIYEPNIYEYVVFQLKDDLKVARIKRPVSSEIKAAAGEIRSSLWQAMTDAGMSYELADKMEGALQWSVDFHHLQKEDQFRLVYDQLFVEDTPAGVGKVYAAYYKNARKEFYAIYYESEDGKIKGYYDQEGRPMKSAFLKAPVKYSRISSYYNLNRFHPILKHVRPHYGTDYAAPYGTEIMAVGDGVVTAASYTNGNGNFVKIKHDKTYETQYLHMQKFAKGIRPGVHVRQGQVIGYVGSTGLATGPHVCFRFWQNGKQVNHLKLNFPNPEPLPAAEMPRFSELRDTYVKQLMAATLPAKDTAETAPATNP